MSKFLVSACLLGDIVRYDGKVNRYDPRFMLMHNAGLCVTVCPEVIGGLSVPRLPAEISHGDGRDILDKNANVIREDGVLVTDAFLEGARAALSLVNRYNIPIAILKSKSPSCGNKMIYDGTFSGRLKEGVGVTTALLMRHGVQVFNELQLDEALQVFQSLGYKLPDNILFQFSK